MSPIPKSSARSDDRKYLPVIPVGAPSSSPRPNVLLASKRRPPRWPSGRGRASAAAAVKSAIPKVATRILRAVIYADPSASIAPSPAFVHNKDVVGLHTAVLVLTS